MSQKPVRSIRLNALSATNLNNALGLNGEIIYDVTNKTLRLYDGATQGGYRLARQDQTAQITLANVTNSTVSAKVLASGVLTWNNIASKPTLSTVATTGSYDDLADLPESFSELTSLSMADGVIIDKFSANDQFTDNSPTAVPTESAVQGYVDRRLGYDRNGDPLPELDKIGPGFATQAELLNSRLFEYGSANNSEDDDFTVDAGMVQLADWTAEFTQGRTLFVENLAAQTRIMIYVRHSGTGSRLISVQASETDSGFAPVNLAVGAGAVTATGVTLAAGGAAVIVLWNAGNGPVGMVN